MAGRLGNLAAAAAAHWKRGLVVVVGVLVALGAPAGAVGGQFSDDFSSPGTESQRALDVLDGEELDRPPALPGEPGVEEPPPVPAGRG